MLEPIKMYREDAFAFIERPASAFARMGQRIAGILERELADGGPEAFTRRIFAPMAAMTPAQWAAAPGRLMDDVQRRRRRVARSPTGEQLLELVDAANARTRNGALLACLHPERHGKASLRALSRIIRINGSRGEARAELVLDAILVVWDEVYQPYLRSVWKLLELSEGRAPLKIPRGGNLMKNLAARLGSHRAAIVEPAALRIRDAVAHPHGHIEHEARGVVLLRNKDGWSEKFRTRELEDILGRMMRASTDTFVAAMNAFMMQATMEPLLPVMPEFARAVVANDSAEIERTGTIVEARQRAIWSEIARLYAQPPLAAS